MMRSFGRPTSMARSALCSAEATTAWRMTSRASSGSGRAEFSSIILVSRSCRGSPVDADADRLVVPARHFNHFGELRVALGAAADIARIDAVLRQCGGATGIFAQQLVAVEMEVPDERDTDAQLIQPFPDRRHRGGGFRRVHGEAHQFGTGTRQVPHLFNGTGDIGRVRIGHGLDDDGIGTADADSPNNGYERFATWMRHGRIVPLNMTAK